MSTPHKNATKSISNKEMKPKKASIKKLVLNLLKEHPGLTRNQISNQLGLRIQTICSVVNELLTSNVVVVSGTTRDTSTNRTVETLGIVGE